MLSYPYNTHERPAAPYIDIYIIPWGQSGISTKQPAKLDTGASLTVIPETLVTQWRLQKHSEVRVRGYNGRRSKRPAYLVDILIGERSFTAVKVMVSQRTNILLGRDVMKYMHPVQWAAANRGNLRILEWFTDFI